MALLEKIGHVLTTDLTKDFKFSKKSKTEADDELTFIDQLKKRRSIYALGKKVHFSQAYIAELIQSAVKSCPSAFNSNSSRIVILFGDSHYKFWGITKEVKRQEVPAQIFEGVKIKIDQCASAYGTVLFYEDQNVIHDLQKKMPMSAEDFPIWSEQTSGMAQFAVWTALADAGLGASLQHYNPSVDQTVAEHFKLDPNWLLRAQLCFGSIEQPAEPRPDYDFQNRFRVFH
ncbi:nitroreductase family protein [Acinetobacter thermotolerans]|uniref:nitroreductase family protein n=1 Tax=Acinetobacter thermotolerans TaxID=3151487 RepID=UPI00325B16D4